MTLWNCILNNYSALNSQTNTLTESVVKWEWELSAMSLFNINHALLPAVWSSGLLVVIAFNTNINIHI